MTKNSNAGKQRTAAPEQKPARTLELDRPAPAKPFEQDFGVARVVTDEEKNRIQLFFSEKPDEAILKLLKDCGFRWSPQNKSWRHPLSNGAQLVVATVLERLGVFE